MLKSYGWWVVVGGGLEQFSVSPRPLGFGFGTKGFGAKGLGPGLDNKRSKLLVKNIKKKFYLCSFTGCPVVSSFSPASIKTPVTQFTHYLTNSHI